MKKNIQKVIAIDNAEAIRKAIKRRYPKPFEVIEMEKGIKTLIFNLN